MEKRINGLSEEKSFLRKVIRAVLIFLIWAGVWQCLRHEERYSDEITEKRRDELLMAQQVWSSLGNARHEGRG